MFYYVLLIGQPITRSEREIRHPPDDPTHGRFDYMYLYDGGTSYDNLHVTTNVRRSD